MSDAALRMDNMYRWQKHIYDLTRKPYLLGRDTLIRELSPPRGGRVLEMGCGTGRNLIAAAKRWPHAQFFGFDLSQEMLGVAEKKIAAAGLSHRITVRQADATHFNSQQLFGIDAFERTFFSYTLSMIPEWQTALRCAAGQIPAGGALMIADFGDQRELPALFRRALHAWLRLFDVVPRCELHEVVNLVAKEGGLKSDFVPLYGGYAFLAALRRS
jgi:S-adenosylmethionine-diacylgycerolhomoserine-N-methlytransferase